MPKLKISYSTIYDSVVQEWKSDVRSYDARKFERINKLVWNPGRILRHRRYAANLQKRWNKISNKAFLTLETVSGLKWKEDLIHCYVLDTPQSLSDPLTIAMSKDFVYDCKSITHELVHRLEFQNPDRIDYDALSKTFRKDTGTTRSHILVHAILKLALPPLFGQKETEIYIKQTNWPDYRRAWQIVEEQGAENIIQEFVKR